LPFGIRAKQVQEKIVVRIQDAVPKAGSKKRRRRLGRGISAGQGASCGKGMRGQKSRSGGSTRPGFEGGQLPLYRRLPKLKHFTVINRKHYTTINVSQLASLPASSEVTLASLMEAGLVTSNKWPLKILGDGELNVPLNVKAAAFSASARAKIEAAGGSCEVLGANA
jgi:large subunit ribosomal protein L15